jgi:hypothetical protein
MKIALTVYLSLLCASSSWALKPAPFSTHDDLRFENSKGLVLTSKRLPNQQNSYSSEAVTTVTKKGHSSYLWSMNHYIGRGNYMLSPDGRILIRWAGPYFGSKISSGNKSLTFEVFEMGKSIKKIYMNEIHTDFQKTARFYQLRRYGGGWVSLYQVFEKIDADWKNRDLKIKSLTKCLKFDF